MVKAKRWYEYRTKEKSKKKIFFLRFFSSWWAIRFLENVRTYRVDKLLATKVWGNYLESNQIIAEQKNSGNLVAIEMEATQ